MHQAGTAEISRCFCSLLMGQGGIGLNGPKDLMKGIQNGLQCIAFSSHKNFIANIQTPGILVHRSWFLGSRMLGSVLGVLYGSIFCFWGRG